MNNELGPSKRESSSILSLSSVGSTTSSSTASLIPRGSWRDCSFRAQAGGASLSLTSSAFHDSFEEEEDSSQSLSDSLYCDISKSAVIKRHSQGSNSGFSDSLDDSSEDIEENTFDSDTCSFYSVNSRLTPQNIPSEVSLLDSKYCSEGTLYDSAQSLTPVPSCQSSFWSLRSCETLDERHRDNISYQGNHRSDLYRPINSFYLDCNSCPDLSPSGIRKTNREEHISTGLNPFPVSQAISDCYINCKISNTNNSSALEGRKLSDSSMSAVEGSASPKVGDEFETKKKKGLMSSFRKSRKTSRKLRQQKKAAADGDTTSTGTGVMSDGEHDLLIDSDASAPNSPAPVKNALMKEDNIDIKIPINKNSETGLDCHQAAHERLNGASTPKESSEPSSKSSSPLLGKSNRVTETAKKFEEKEEKKLGKNKFGSSLFRKKKAEQQSTQSLSKDSTDATEGETPEIKDLPKTEPEQPSTDDSLPEGTSELPASEQAESADMKSSSFRSYISSVQLVKNWTVNSDVPKSQLSTETLAKTSRDAVDGGKVAVEGKAITPEGTSTTTIETKKVTTASANGKPSATEVTSKKTTTVTIVSKQQSPKLRGSPMSVAGRGKGAVSPSSPPVKGNPKVSPVNVSAKNNSRRSKSPSPVLPNKSPQEMTTTPTTDDTKTNKNDPGINTSRHQVPPPVTVTPPASSNPTNSPHSQLSQVDKALTNETQQPPRIVINEPQQSPKKVVSESSQPRSRVTKDSQPSRETQPPKTLSNTSQPLQKVTVSDPLQSKFSITNQSQEPKYIPVNENLQSKRPHENKQPIKIEPSGETKQPRRVPLRLNAGDTGVTPNQVPLPVLPSPGMVTPPSSPEGNSERDARETPEGDRTENEKNSLLDSTGLTDSWAGTSTDKREHLYKILVIGELGTGKTSIIKRYVHQFFSQHYRATIGVDFALKVLNWDNNTVIRLQLWDIAGQERFGNMTRVYYKEAVGAFVVFDVTRAQTFDAVTKWKTDLDTKVTLADGSPIPAVLLANKCDQPKEGVVNNPARMDDYCRERGFSGWFETSAKENINIDEASRFLVNKILNNEKQGMMMTESLDTDKFSVDGKANPVDRSGCRC